MSKEFVRPYGGIHYVKVRTSTDHISTQGGDVYDGKFDTKCIRIIDPWIDAEHITYLGLILSIPDGALTSKYGDGMEIIKSCIEFVSFDGCEAQIHLRRDLDKLDLKTRDGSHFEVAIYLDKYIPGPPIIADRKAFVFFEGGNNCEKTDA